MADRVVVWISSPVQWVVVSTLDGISNAWSRYIALVGVEAENEQLRAKVAQLESELAKHLEQAKENQRLRLLLDLKDRAPDVPTVSARVVGTSPTPLFRSVRIDRGTDQGVHVGAAVVNHEGVVGRVAAVSGGWADVMLMVDANSSTDVRILRTRERARVRGLGEDEELNLRVEYLPRTEDVRPGDLLVTSGVGTVFPKGLLVGRVVSVEKRAFGLYQQAKVEPVVDFGRLEEVMVIPRGWPPDTRYEREEDALPAPEEPAPEDERGEAMSEAVEEGAPPASPEPPMMAPSPVAPPGDAGETG